MKFELIDTPRQRWRQHLVASIQRRRRVAMAHREIDELSAQLIERVNLFRQRAKRGDRVDADYERNRIAAMAEELCRMDTSRWYGGATSQFDQYMARLH